MAETTDLGLKKTFCIFAAVIGCFAMLWPTILHPVFIGFVTPHHSRSDVCCEVIFESDVTAVDIMQEMCQNILRHHPIDPRVRDALKLSKLTPQTASLCREEVLARCGIDLSSFLAERESLGKTYKQVLEEIRSFNSSLCLKMNFGVPLSQLGTPHLIRYHILMPHNAMPQERPTPPHAGGMHPALRERGRAIPSSHIIPKIMDRPDQPDNMQKMRPPPGGAGHVVPAPKGNNPMGIIMPVYTVAIIVFKINTESEIISEYSGAAAEREFRRKVFNPEALAAAITVDHAKYCTFAPYYLREESPYPAPTIEELNDPIIRTYILNTFDNVLHAGTQEAAGDIEIDQLRQRLVETEAAMERIVVQMGNISRSVKHNASSQPEIKVYQINFDAIHIDGSPKSNGLAGLDRGSKEDTADQESHSKEDEELDVALDAALDAAEQSPTVKVMGMEMTASCESGQKCSRPTTPIIPAPSNIEREKTPPTPIYLEGALPPQCELLVTDSETQAEKSEDDDDAPVVLSGKMTLSLISLDQIPAVRKY
ncbi:hypothetical protein ALC60_02391 [Trachymyrmex zeteki]|uniref:Resistance to inhibitors of cholinesterase protein 3 N-terminal domain-containing protein n=1 Tax=Mycetomoellerius zeteki TaxID=64791 RepID=A0A151XEF3_9HYME|nr:hypothetical protein ALC60_02391 [Trachymyrmex zeteki]